jgi:hypothetical protein
MADDKAHTWTQAQVQRLARSLVAVARDAGLQIAGVEAYVGGEGLRIRVLTVSEAAEAWPGPLRKLDTNAAVGVTEAEAEALRERIRRAHGRRGKKKDA